MYAELARYNAERARGLVHTEEWQQRMAEVQALFDAEPRTTVVLTTRPRRWWRRLL